MAGPQDSNSFLQNIQIYTEEEKYSFIKALIIKIEQEEDIEDINEFIKELNKYGINFNKYLWQEAGDSLMHVIAKHPNGAEIIKCLQALDDLRDRLIDLIKADQNSTQIIDDIDNNLMILIEEYRHSAQIAGTLQQFDFFNFREIDINYKNKYGITPLHLAAEHGHIEIAELLIENGANVDAKNNGNVTALHLAAQNGHTGIVSLLIANDVDIDVKISDGRTSLHLAAEHGHLEIAEHLVENGANIDEKDHDGRTPFCAAANKYEENSEMVRLLIEKGANIEDIDNLGRPFIRYVLPQHKSQEVVDYYEYCYIKKHIEHLIEDEADLNIRYNGKIYLCWAAEHGHLEIAKLLLANGANVNVKDEDNITALHLAAQNGHLEIAKFLVENGANVNVKDEDNVTALHLAAQNGHTGIVSLLIANDVDIDVKISDGRTSLRIAAEKGYIEIAKLLIEKGANVDEKDNYGQTPFCAAANKYEENSEMIRLLIEKGANIEDSDNLGRRFITYLLPKEKRQEVVDYYEYWHSEKHIRRLIEDNTDIDMEKGRIPQSEAISVLKSDKVSSTHNPQFTKNEEKRSKVQEERLNH